MVRTQRGTRWVAAFSSLALTTLLTAFGPPASAFDPVSDGGGDGGCPSGCQPQAQTSSLTGTATSGAASNQNGASNYQLDYGVPNDANNLYSGTFMIQIVDTNNNVSIYTGAIADHANGGGGYFSYAGLPPIPTGGSASITINESAPNGNSFQAGYVVNNFGR